MDRFTGLSRFALHLTDGFALVPVACSLLFSNTLIAAGADGYSWQQTKDHIALMQDGKAVWQFNVGTDASKPFFHPIQMPDGSILTHERPDDHIWHLGAWFSWKYLNRKNFWEEDKNHRGRDGDTVIKSVKFAPHPDMSAGIHLQIDYITHDGAHLLSENRDIKISRVNERGEFSITSDHKFRAVEDTVINNYFYGGFSLRMKKGARTGWTFVDANRNTWIKGQKSLKEFKYPFILTGPPSSWIAFVEKFPGKTQGIAILDHATNLRHPGKWLILPDMPFFSPVIHYGEDILLERGDMLNLKYRILIWEDRNATNYVESQQAEFNH